MPDLNEMVREGVRNLDAAPITAQLATAAQVTRAILTELGLTIFARVSVQAQERFFPDRQATNGVPEGLVLVVTGHVSGLPIGKLAVIQPRKLTLWHPSQERLKYSVTPANFQEVLTNLLLRHPESKAWWEIVLAHHVYATEVNREAARLASTAYVLPFETSVAPDLRAGVMRAPAILPEAPAPTPVPEPEVETARRSVYEQILEDTWCTEPHEDLEHKASLDLPSKPIEQPERADN